MRRPKILWGVCGIGHGHTFRQLPLIEHFANSSDIVIFAYGESYDYYTKRFAGHSSVTVENVAVPFYVGNEHGLDFEATAKHPANQGVDYHAINSAAMAQAEQRIGKPDLVVSDYEPVSAQYAYANNVPLVTIDQQSKYLCGDFQTYLNGHTFEDEIQRLRMFFPQAHSRLACSFFNITKKTEPAEEVEIFPPVLSETVTNISRSPDPSRKSILIYISSQQPFGQPMEEIAKICKELPDCQFNLFGKNIAHQEVFGSVSNLTTYEHGNPCFHEILASCNGVVSTAGHTLLSEAMHLGIPVYAIPLPLYEQQMNAHVINENSFGISCERFDPTILDGFIQDLPRYAVAIESDNKILLRNPGQKGIINHLNSYIAGSGLP